LEEALQPAKLKASFTQIQQFETKIEEECFFPLHKEKTFFGPSKISFSATSTWLYQN